MNKKYLVIILFISLLPFGCKRKNTLSSEIEQNKSLAQECLTLLRNGDINDVKNMLDNRLLEKNATENLIVFSRILNQSEILSEDFVGFSMFATKENKLSKITYQYKFKDSWAIANVTIGKVEQNRKIMGITLSPISESLEETNAFAFSGKSIVHYIIMLFAIINPIIIMAAFVICIMTNMKKLKWLWILFIVFGIGNIALNWTTGQVIINPLSILLIGSGYSKMSQFLPLVINISIPLGAVLFLILRNKLKVTEPAKQGLEIPSPADSQDTSGQATKD